MSAIYDHVIILEDDLILSPNFYDYSCQTSTFYQSDKRIAGISLYSYRFNEYCYLPFFPLKDENDVFFMQVPSSWGQIWSKEQWERFKYYLENEYHGISVSDKLPDAVKDWDDRSWKKIFFKYVIEKNLFFVYPFNSLSTNFSDSGVHYEQQTQLFQVPLVNSVKKLNIKMIPLDLSLCVYDAFFELLFSCYYALGFKKKQEFIPDLYGSKPLELWDETVALSSKLLLDKKINSLNKFSSKIYPLENNILLDIKGNNIAYSSKESFVNEDKRLKIAADLAPLADLIGRERGMEIIKNTRTYKLGNFLLLPKHILKKLRKK